MITWAVDKLLPKNFREVVAYAVPTAAALLIVLSWPTLDVQSTAHDLLHSLSAPGHGVIGEVAAWLQAPERHPWIAPLSGTVGALFALGGANRPLGSGRCSAIAWVAMLPLVVVEGRSAIGGIVSSWVATMLMVLLFSALASRVETTASDPEFFSPSDVRTMAFESIVFAVAVPFAPVLVGVGLIFASLSWPRLRPLPVPAAKRRNDTEADAA